jgi:metal-dependent amidase/aminoacylase/carboxypeptidase family protein
MASAKSSELGTPTLTPTVMHSGDGVNIVPGSAEVWCDRRVVDGEDIETVAEALQKSALSCALASGQCVDVQAVRTCSVSPFLIASDNEFVRTLERLSGARAITVSFGTNASEYAPAASRDGGSTSSPAFASRVDNARRAVKSAVVMVSCTRLEYLTHCHLAAGTDMNPDTHTHAHTHTHTTHSTHTTHTQHTHTYTHARTHTHTHTYSHAHTHTRARARMCTGSWEHRPGAQDRRMD